MYEELKSAVGRGLHVENLWAIVRLCTTLLQTDRLANPIIAFTIKAVCERLASSQDGQAVSADHGDLADAHLLSAIQRLLDVAYGGADEICEALNQVARAYADTLPRS